ncbi:hypothetical protein BDW60DRAFT_184709 [Aspergillus nidulans var. acristatus]
MFFRQEKAQISLLGGGWLIGHCCAPMPRVGCPYGPHECTGSVSASHDVTWRFFLRLDTLVGSNLHPAVQMWRIMLHPQGQKVRTATYTCG